MNSLTNIQDIINSSGNTFQSKVVKYFRDKQWDVTVSPYYNDNLTDKPREIDIVGVKRYPVRDFMNTYLGSVVVRLFIECKYMADTALFWFDDIDKNNALNRAMKDTGLDSPDRDIRIQSHHYCTTSTVAKLFASGQKVQNENDVFYKAINQCLNAYLYYKNKLSAIHEKNQNDLVLRVVNYPLIICDKFTTLFETDFDNNTPENITNNFLAEINYAYLNESKESKDEYFLVNVLDYNKLDDFLKNIENDEINKVVQAQAQKDRQNNITKASATDFGGFMDIG